MDKMNEAIKSVKYLRECLSKLRKIIPHLSTTNEIQHSIDFGTYEINKLSDIQNNSVNLKIGLFGICSVGKTHFFNDFAFSQNDFAFSQNDILENFCDDDENIYNNLIKDCPFFTSGNERKKGDEVFPATSISTCEQKIRFQEEIVTCYVDVHDLDETYELMIKGKLGKKNYSKDEWKRFVYDFFYLIRCFVNDTVYNIIENCDEKDIDQCQIQIDEKLNKNIFGENVNTFYLKDDKIQEKRKSSVYEEVMIEINEEKCFNVFEGFEFKNKGWNDEQKFVMNVKMCSKIIHCIIEYSLDIRFASNPLLKCVTVVGPFESLKFQENDSSISLMEISDTPGWSETSVVANRTKKILQEMDCIIIVSRERGFCSEDLDMLNDIIKGRENDDFPFILYVNNNRDATEFDDYDITDMYSKLDEMRLSEERVLKSFRGIRRDLLFAHLIAGMTFHRYASIYNVGVVNWEPKMNMIKEALFLSVKNKINNKIRMIMNYIVYPTYKLLEEKFILQSSTKLGTKEEERKNIVKQFIGNYKTKSEELLESFFKGESKQCSYKWPDNTEPHLIKNTVCSYVEKSDEFKQLFHKTFLGKDLDGNLFFRNVSVEGNTEEKNRLLKFLACCYETFAKKLMELIFLRLEKREYAIISSALNSIWIEPYNPKDERSMKYKIENFQTDEMKMSLEVLKNLYKHDYNDDKKKFQRSDEIADNLPKTQYVKSLMFKSFKRKLDEMLGKLDHITTDFITENSDFTSETEKVIKKLKNSHDFQEDWINKSHLKYSEKVMKNLEINVVTFTYNFLKFFSHDTIRFSMMRITPFLTKGLNVVQKLAENMNEEIFANILQQVESKDEKELSKIRKNLRKTFSIYSPPKREIEITADLYLGKFEKNINYLNNDNITNSQQQTADSNKEPLSQKQIDQFNELLKKTQITIDKNIGKRRTNEKQIKIEFGTDNLINYLYNGEFNNEFDPKKHFFNIFTYPELIDDVKRFLNLHKQSSSSIINSFKPSTQTGDVKFVPCPIFVPSKGRKDFSLLYEILNNHDFEDKIEEFMIFVFVEKEEIQSYINYYKKNRMKVEGISVIWVSIPNGLRGIRFVRSLILLFVHKLVDVLKIDGIDFNKCWMIDDDVQNCSVYDKNKRQPVNCNLNYILTLTEYITEKYMLSKDSNDDKDPNKVIGELFKKGFSPTSTKIVNDKTEFFKFCSDRNVEIGRFFDDKNLDVDKVFKVINEIYPQDDIYLKECFACVNKKSQETEKRYKNDMLKFPNYQCRIIDKTHHSTILLFPKKMKGYLYYKNIESLFLSDTVIMGIFHHYKQKRALINNRHFFYDEDFDFCDELKKGGKVGIQILKCLVQYGNNKKGGITIFDPKKGDNKEAEHYQWIPKDFKGDDDEVFDEIIHHYDNIPNFRQRVKELANIYKQVDVETGCTLYKERMNVDDDDDEDNYSFLKRRREDEPVLHDKKKRKKEIFVEIDIIHNNNKNISNQRYFNQRYLALSPKFEKTPGISTVKRNDDFEMKEKEKDDKNNNNDDIDDDDNMDDDETFV